MNKKQIVKRECGIKLDNYLTRITPFGFSGAILVAEKEKVILNEGYGMAIREKGVPNTAETVFCTGSITKQFTATAIMRLEMQDKLDTGDHITEYFDNVPKDKGCITIHNLLTHTAGVIGNAGDDYEIVSRDETIRRVLGSPLLFSPGKRYEYSNAGYSLLGAIVEIVSAQSYERFLNDQLFAPAKMSFTGYRIPDWSERVIADWYVREANNRNSLVKPFPYWNLIGNGGILSTSGDMYKWYLAMKSDAILSSDAKKKLLTPFLEDYAYGWGVSETEYGTLITHDGGNDLGASANFKWFVDCDLILILFCNQSYGKATLAIQVRDKIVKIAFGKNVTVPPAVLDTVSFGLKKFEGTYRLPTGSHFIVSSEAGALKLAAKGQDAIKIIFPPEQDKTLEYVDLNNRVIVLSKVVIKGDYSSLENELEDKNTLDRKRRLVESMLSQRELGSLKEIEVVGTFPFPRREDVLETVVQWKFTKENIAFGLCWRKGKLWGITAEPDRPEVLLRPVSEMAFAGYHLGLARNAEISFDVDSEGFVKELTCKGNGGKVTALKV